MDILNPLYALYTVVKGGVIKMRYWKCDKCSKEIDGADIRSVYIKTSSPSRTLDIDTDLDFCPACAKDVMEYLHSLTQTNKKGEVK